MNDITQPGDFVRMVADMDYLRSVEERVRRGADLIDAYDAGDWDWRADIDEGRFDVTSFDDCVLGQKFPDLSFYEALNRIECADSHECGFRGYNARDWRALQDAWLREFNR